MRCIAIIRVFLSSGLVSGATAQVCELKGEAPACAAPEATGQRIRYEVGDLPKEVWQKVVDAFWIMKTMSMEDGKAMYGSSFRTADYFVVKHAVAALDSRGEQAHFGDWFITFHGAFILEFENALLSVDPSIGAMPYWDVASHDAFSPEYFGSAPGTGPNNEVIDGAFAEWPITQNFDLSSYTSYFKTGQGAEQLFTGSSTGFLRGNYPPNTLVTEFVTRYGSSSDWFFSTENQSKCLQTECWDDWYHCIDAQDGDVDFHTGVHKVVGGILLDPSEENSSVSPPVRPLTKHGDLEDSNTSPNDPVFMFVHANLERNKAAWMAAHSSELSNYYGYGGDQNECFGAPWYEEKCTTGGYYGVNLGDVISSQFPFSSEDLGLSALDTPGITHAEYLCYVGPTTAPYTYADPGTPWTAPTPAPPLMCSSWCAANTQPFSVKVTWTSCNGCTDPSASAPAATPAPPLMCSSWCASNTHPFSVKVTWTSCNGCGEQEPTPRRLGTSLSKSVVQMPGLLLV